MKSGCAWRRSWTFLAVCGCFLLLVAPDAHAYTDPGSGTLLLQMAFAAFFGLMFYARRISAWMRRLVGKRHDPAPTARVSETVGPPPDSAAGR
jgi:hypothetical protein